MKKIYLIIIIASLALPACQTKQQEANCTLTTCDSIGANCGTIDDGCGGMLYCGACSGTETCGAAGTPNQCGNEPACKPQCSGRECGPDPTCGASCGKCQKGKCNSDGHCSTIGQSCDPLTQAPCLANEKCSLVQSNGATQCMALGSKLEGQMCGTGATVDDCARGLMCVLSTGASQPRCTRICDYNASSANCSSGSRCVFQVGANNVGVCSLTCDPFSSNCDAASYCTTYLDEVGPFSFCETKPTTLPKLGQTCTSICDTGLLCVNSDGQPKCYRMCNPGHPCQSGSCLGIAVDGTTVPGAGFCEQCFPQCGSQVCGTESACGTSCGTCSNGDVCTSQQTCCTPNCNGKNCGADGCGGTCGSCSGYQTCGVNGVCGCVPQCNGKNCGADGCGGTCGACGGSQTCNAGQCCTPNCNGKNCGADGCGGTCGSCSGNQTCGVNGVCACVPQCSGKNCGSDGCGGTCGTCGGSQTCNAGQCCTPNCSGKQCGSNGCGGSCGPCSGSQICSNYQCITAPCDPVAQTVCQPSQRCIWNGSANVCVANGSAPAGSYCTPDNCQRGSACASFTDYDYVCRRYCRYDTDCSADGKCAYTINGTNLKLCSIPCNPLASGTCNSGMGCHVINVGPVSEVTDCGALGIGGSGSGCTDSNDCLSNYSCASSQCHRVCSAGGSCTSGTCTSLSGWDDYGLCQ